MLVCQGSELVGSFLGVRAIMGEHSSLHVRCYLSYCIQQSGIGNTFPFLQVKLREDEGKRQNSPSPSVMVNRVSQYFSLWRTAYWSRLGISNNHLKL